MFETTRLQLTAWYLLIIMLICLLFSVAFYRVSTQEVQRLINRIERMQEQLPNFPQPPDAPTLSELEAAKRRLVEELVFINLSILAFAGAAGYFLAGKTLQPIREMVDEQNRFITDASHELRTPLTVLRAEMEAYLLENRQTIQEANTLVKSNLEEVITIQTLSDNLLQLSKHRSHEDTSVAMAVSLLQILEDALKKVMPLAKVKHILIDNQVDDGMLEGKAHDLCSVFVILLDNAIKYSDEKTTITLRSQQLENMIHVTVADQGMGIEKKEIPHIFDRFYRADALRTKKQVTGHGLGLSIAKSIVEDHGGEITVRSRVGKGTTFTLHLPLKK